MKSAYVSAADFAVPRAVSASPKLLGELGILNDDDDDDDRPGSKESKDSGGSKDSAPSRSSAPPARRSLGAASPSSPRVDVKSPASPSSKKTLTVRRFSSGKGTRELYHVAKGQIVCWGHNYSGGSQFITKERLRVR